MIFRLKKRFRFESSHQLKNHDGKCARLHGHSWTGYFEVSGNELDTKGPKENMLIDYGELGAIAKQIEAKYDHYHLNDVLKSDMPTSELVAAAIWQFIEFRIAEQKNVRLSRVVINETCTSECVVEESK